MNRLDSAIIDIFDDVNLGSTLQKVASQLPQDVRSGELPSLEERNEYDDMQFALSIITKTASKVNKFPVNTRINTAMSNQYFDLNHHKLPSEAQKIAATYIKVACERFNLDPSDPVKVAAEKFPVMTNIFIEKISSKPGGKLIVKEAQKIDSEYAYALTKQAGDGTTNRKYAMPNKEYMDKAVEYFDKFASQFSPEDRHQFASNVVKRSLELNVEVKSESINKYAGLSYNSNVGNYLTVRRKLLEDHPQYTDALDKLASYQETTDPVTFAKVLHELDKKAGIDKYYDSYLADPYLSTFGKETTKTASYVYNQDGILLTNEDILKVASDKYATLKNYFGHTLADGLKKEGSAAFVALPTDAKDIIARIANGEIQ